MLDKTPITPLFQSLEQEIDILIKPFSHTKKDIGYGYRRTFENEMRCDLIDYKKKNIYIFRIGRGAWLVKQHPMLYGLFDEVMKVIAKFEVRSVQTLYDKHITGIFALMDQAPKGVTYDGMIKK